MRNNFIKIISFIFIASATFAETTAQTRKGAKELLIAHTNDTHSRIEPMEKNDPKREQANKGGYLRRATVIDSLRQEYGKNMLLLDCGDFSQGTPYYNVFKGDVEIDLMNKLGYDAGTIGNHEFDFGMENMRRLFLRANFPILCANYDFSGTILENVVKPYTIIKRNGLKIGIIGLGPVLEGLVFEKNYRGIKYLDPTESVNKYADLLKNKMHCSLVVVISHLGWKTGANEPSDDIVVPKTRNIDIVLGGHTHTYFTGPINVKNLDGKDVPVNQMGKNGRFLGTIKVEFQKQ